MKRIMVLALVAVFVVAMSGMAMAVSDTDIADVTARIMGESVQIEINDFVLNIADADIQQSASGDWKADTNTNAFVRFESRGMQDPGGGIDDGAGNPYNNQFEYQVYENGNLLGPSFPAGGDSGDRNLGGVGKYGGEVELTYLAETLPILAANVDYSDVITVTISSN